MFLNAPQCDVDNEPKVCISDEQKTKGERQVHSHRLDWCGSGFRAGGPLAIGMPPKNGGVSEGSDRFSALDVPRAKTFDTELRVSENTQSNGFRIYHASTFAGLLSTSEKRQLKFYRTPVRIQRSLWYGDTLACTSYQ